MSCWWLVGCGPTLPPLTTTPPISTPALPSSLLAPATDEAAVIALILAERQAAIDQDLALLGQLWAEDAQIVDGRNSPNPDDDYRWQGRAAILDRYRVAVFPFVLPTLPALADGATVTIQGDRATVQHGIDRWQARKVADRWWLAELRYQTPAGE